MKEKIQQYNPNTIKKYITMELKNSYIIISKSQSFPLITITRNITYNDKPNRFMSDDTIAEFNSFDLSNKKHYIIFPHFYQKMSEVLDIETTNTNELARMFGETLRPIINNLIEKYDLHSIKDIPINPYETTFLTFLDPFNFESIRTIPNPEHTISTKIFD